jgi:hypothetical protein
MNKEVVFAIAFIATFSLASIAGITHASTPNTEKETLQASTNQTAILNSNTAIFYNATLSAELNKLINSDNFKQTIAKWSTTKKTQPSYELGDPKYPYQSYYASSVYTYSYGPEWGAGRLYSPENIVGYSDVTYARFHTEVWRPDPYGDEAILIATMQATVTGDIWLTGYSGQYTSSDVYVFASTTPNLPMEQWMGIGYAHFTQGSPQSVYVGTTTTAYSYMAVFAYAYNQAPFTEQNDAYVDSITIVHDLGW